MIFNSFAASLLFRFATSIWFPSGCISHVLLFKFDRWPFHWLTTTKFVLVDLLHKVVHEDVNVNVFLSRCIVVLHSLTFSHLLSLLSADLSLVGQVNLVANKNFRDACICMRFNLFEPHAYIVKWFLIRNIKAENDALRLLVEGECQCAESLLTSRVPDLNLHILSAWWSVCFAHKI